MPHFHSILVNELGLHPAILVSKCSARPTCYTPDSPVSSVPPVVKVMKNEGSSIETLIATVIIVGGGLWWLEGWLRIQKAAPLSAFDQFIALTLNYRAHWRFLCRAPLINLYSSLTKEYGEHGIV